MNERLSTSLKSFALISLLAPLAACSSGGGSSDRPAPVAKFSNAVIATGLAPTGDGAPVSAERALLDQAIADAKTQNKAVILEVSAAWCGPCTTFLKEMNDNPTNFQDLASKGYIFVKDEFEKSAETDSFDISDYLPKAVGVFPSFYLYRPGQPWQPLGSLNSYQDLLAALQNVSAMSAPLSVDEMKAALEIRGEGTTPEEKQLRLRYYYLTGNLSTTYNYGEARALLKLIEAKAGTDKNQLGEATYFETNFLPDYIVAGAIDLPNLAIDFPNVAADLTDVSREDFTPSLFEKKMLAIVRSSGLKAAAAQCDSTYQSVRSGFVAGTLSADEFAKKLSGLDARAKVDCADLIVRSGGSIQAAKDEIANIDPKLNTNWRLVEAVGDDATALTLYQAQYKTYADYYTAAIATKNKAIADATAANEDATKIKSLTDALAFTTFQQAHHAEVDADVEKAISAGQYVPQLERQN